MNDGTITNKQAVTPPNLPSLPEDLKEYEKGEKHGGG